MYRGIQMAILYHNPLCSKSRQALALCDASPRDVSVHFYLSDPLEYETLLSLLSRLEGEVSSAIRWNDSAFKEFESLNIDRMSVEPIASFLSVNGHLMERHLLDNGHTTRIGRPVENLLELLQ